MLIPGEVGMASGNQGRVPLEFLAVRLFEGLPLPEAADSNAGRFSADGNEVIAGGRGYIYVYDLLANKRSKRLLSSSSNDMP